MSRRFSLASKIVCVAALNALLIAILLAATGAVPWPSDLQAFAMSAAGPAIGEVSQRLAVDLMRAAPDDAERLLGDYSREFGVAFAVHRSDGTRVAGPALTLPSPVLDAIREAGRQPPAGPGGGRGGRGARGRPGGGPFLVRVSGTPSYWIGSRLMLTAPNGDATPATLLIVSDTFLGNPFLLRSMRWVLVALVAAALSFACWAPLLRSVTRAVARLEQATAQISEGRFDGRVDGERGDELGRLGQSINRMAARIDSMVSGQTRFLGDTAHELRSPLGRMQVALGLLDTRVAEGDRGYVNDLHEDVDLMSGMTTELLEFARDRLAPRTDPPRAIPLAGLIERVVKLEGGAEATIGTAVAGDLAVAGYDRELARAIGNVVRNAVRYAGASGPITVAAGRVNGSIEIVVSDCGAGVPPESIERLFEPFFRLDPSRNRRSGGAGLGLAIARGAVEACGGRITARNRVPSGLEVTITLPRAVDGKETASRA